MKTIGLLGGIGPQATMELEARIHRAAQRRIPPRMNGGYPRLVVWYCRHPPIVVDERGHAKQPLEPHPLLLDAAAKLGSLVDFLILGSNGADALRAHVERASGRPVVSIIEATLAEVRRRDWRRVGVIAMGDGAIYSKPLGAAGVACETLEPYGIARAVFAVMEGRIDDAARAVARDAVADLRGRNVDGIILGCTELPLMLGTEADEAADLINSNQMLADATVNYAIA